MAKANLNPAEAHRKALQKKEVKKNKAARKTNRDAAIAKKDTFELEESIRKLTEQEDAGKLSADDAQRLKDQRFELARIKKIKEAYIKDHPDEAHKVYRSAPRVKQDAQEAPRGRDGRKLRTRRIFDEKTGLPRHPERSLYYDPVMNPYGVPPPGMPYAERPLLPGEVDSEAEDESSEDEQDEDDDDDIPMPPDHDPELDDIPMPEGPPPGAEDDADFVPPLPDGPPPLPSEPPPLPPAAPPLPLSAPPLPLGAPPGFIPPPPPGGPPVFQQGFVPPPPPGFPPGAPGLIPPPPPGGPPCFAVPPPPPGLSIPPPPPGGPPGFAIPPPPPGGPPGFAIPPPPPGAPPYAAQYYPPPPPPLSAFYAQPPLPSSAPQAHTHSHANPPLPPPANTRPPPAHTPFIPPPSAHLPRRPDAPPAVIAAEPELRDLRKEATAFVPAALRKAKRKAGDVAGGVGKGVEAAQGADGVDEALRPPDLGEALRKKVRKE